MQVLYFRSPHSIIHNIVKIKAKKFMSQINTNHKNVSLNHCA